ncbi:retinol dehydrogenase 13-like [Mizuhopecten yessoensis]|uniref:Retinol dehydrogenase 13 n=1 Tax=Mizuhopecten yessoensis TaxID=6573 RepID=A0A210QRW5_MIZYE|nr:retinol dehydrogenase 13-like [Mizuhopecten yessoensis]OWF51449.1 Retinol dehydrogenase 13 [Mizuhopecten yessoensis]
MVKKMTIPGMGDMPDPEWIFESWWPIIFGVTIGSLYAFRQYMRGARCLSEAKLEGKVAIVTGAGSGLGKFIAEDLASRGARVYLACHTSEQTKTAVESIKEKYKKANVVGLVCDLASFKSIEEFVSSYRKKEETLDLLIHNAGVMMCPLVQTEDKFETHFQVNYLGPFLLTHLLLPLLKKVEGSRIVCQTAPAYSLGKIDFDDVNYTEREYVTSKAYSQSKLALVLFSLALSRQGLVVNCALPGIANTKIYRHLPFQKNSVLAISFAPIVWFLMKSTEDGAQTGLYCALTEHAGKVSGKLFKECAAIEVEENARDEELQDKLFAQSLKWIGKDKFGEES